MTVAALSPARPNTRGSQVANPNHEWLGTLPPHWSTKRLKYLSVLQTGLTLGKDYGTQVMEVRPYLRVANVQDGYLDLETITEVIVSVKDAPRYELRKGDVLMTEGGDFDKLGRGYVWSGEIARCLHQNHIFVVRPDPKQLHPRFLAAVMTSHYGKAYFTSTSQQTTNLACTNSTKIREVLIPLPPFKEQAQIVAGLDNVITRIDGLIERKRRLITLLEEKRSALINRAVTKGLDPGVLLTDSGVPWLGRIPAHWQILPLRRVVHSMCNGPFGSDMKSSHYSDDGVRLIRLQNIGSGVFDDSDRAYISERHFQTLPGHDALPGDLLVAGLGDASHPVGRACVLPPSVTRAMVKADCFRLRLNEGRMLHRYAALFLSSRCARNELALQIRGATRDRVNLSRVAQVRLPCPPVHEQLEIVSAGEHSAGQTVRTAALISRQITRLEEYRTALISAAITGKIDVRPEAT